MTEDHDRPEVEPEPVDPLVEYLATQEKGLRSVRRWLLVLFVFTIVALTVLAFFSASLSQQKCGEAYANAEYAATTPVANAQKELNAADAEIWLATQKILSQSAGPADYAALRRQIRQRNVLWRQLVAAQKAHPIPPSPDQFCS